MSVKVGHENYVNRGKEEKIIGHILSLRAVEICMSTVLLPVRKLYESAGVKSYIGCTSN
jgi:hypothetical protein